MNCIKEVEQLTFNYEGSNLFLKKFVVDTSVLLYDVEALYQFKNNEVIIPSVVYEEINIFKEEDSERGYYARQVVNLLERLSKENPLRKGVMLGDTKIRTSYDLYNEEIAKSLQYDQNDYKIISCAKNNDAILVTRDKMMRVIARDFVQVEEYEADQINVKESYKGYRQIFVPESYIERLYSKQLFNEFDLYPNEFAILINECNPEHVGIGICKNNRILPCYFDNMNVNGLKLKMKPLTLEQKMMMYLLLDDSISCVSIEGASGKGKTLLSVDFALAMVFSKQFNQFMYTKSVIAVDKHEELGFYKGGPHEKLLPHLQPLLSALEILYEKEIYSQKERKSVQEKLEELINQDVIRTFPLANIRGMSNRKKVVMLDEAQNTTRHMIKTAVTRMVTPSKLIVTGDRDQIDNRNLNKHNNALTHLIEAGKEETFIGHITLDLEPESNRGALATFGSKKL